MKRFLSLFAVAAVLISCFLPCVYADNTVATSTDIYLTGFCNTNSGGTITAICPVVGGFPLGFKRSESASDTVPSITYWEYYGATYYYRVNLGTIGTGQTNIAFSLRILDELGSSYNNDVSSSLNTLRIRSDQGDVSYDSLSWTVKDSQVFTGQSYSNVSFSCVLNSDTTVTNAYMVIGIAYDSATIPAIVQIPQYKWSGPVNGFGSTWYQDMDIYPNGDQYYIPVDEATYMEACYDAYSAASYFSYFGQGMMSQTLDLDIIIDAVQQESRVLQAQNEALSWRVINNVNANVDAAEEAINTNIDEAEESLNANIDEESQNIQDAIGDQTSDLETYFQPIIDHYNEVDQVGEELGDAASGVAFQTAESDLNQSLSILPDYGSFQNYASKLFSDSSGFFDLMGVSIPVLIGFGVNSPSLSLMFIIIVFFLFIFLILKIIRGD